MEEKDIYNCESCRYKCNNIANWKKHIATELHKTGKRKKRSDYGGPYECEECKYKTNNATIFKQHRFNSHSSKETREKEFKYYGRSKKGKRCYKNYHYISDMINCYNLL